MIPKPNPPRPVIVGVAPGQPPRVVEQAADFALRFGTELVCAFVDQARLPLSEGADGSVTSASIDPDLADDAGEVFDARLALELEHILKDSGVSWRTLVLAGEVSAALGRLAERIDASMIVVGTHEHSVGGSIQEFFNRSVATHLAHRQTRPVVVIPARTPGSESPLPRRDA
ncbi:universal stress protein [Paeniglutamicibacter kerguelensis]|uniref:Nucleotide-binding universal stress UspA family protein n=1 Tax=Paeniglutamicibacter kerguelensis TaxID=254788 RepID=A0ABS4XBR3_9MICC|nr:universal stress protein [Paeniglutamicibacter kerguelensis]MBP2385912.1 nucleotide-binding universal stress UspA family protein [Paeniglutamicibacter kerguelensis]